MAHTPGPWEIPLSDPAFVYALNSFRDENVFDLKIHGGRNVPAETIAANARLIAAAPDLLAALKWCQCVMVQHKTFCPAAEQRGACNCGMQRVHDAIAKAEGKD